MAQYTMFKGDTLELLLAIVYVSNGAPVNLQGCHLAMYGKRTAADLDSAAVFTVLDTGPDPGIVVADAANGKATVMVPPGATSMLVGAEIRLVYKIVVTTPLGAVFTIETGSLTIKAA